MAYIAILSTTEFTNEENPNKSINMIKTQLLANAAASADGMKR